jgi:hypothetical protein
MNVVGNTEFYEVEKRDILFFFFKIPTLEYIHKPRYLKIQSEARPYEHENTHKACISGTGHMLIIAVVMTIIKFPNAVLDRNKPEGQTFVICPSITSPQDICAFPYLSSHSLLAITSTTQLTENTCVHLLLFTQFSINYSLVRWYYDIYA